MNMYKLIKKKSRLFIILQNNAISQPILFISNGYIPSYFFFYHLYSIDSCEDNLNVSNRTSTDYYRFFTFSNLTSFTHITWGIFKCFLKCKKNKNIHFDKWGLQYTCAHIFYEGIFNGEWKRKSKWLIFYCTRDE